MGQILEITTVPYQHEWKESPTLRPQSYPFDQCQLNAKQGRLKPKALDL